MLNFFSWFLIPLLTVSMAGPGNWTETNFSVSGSRPPGQLLLLLWGAATGGYFYSLLRRTASRIPGIKAEKRLTVPAAAAALLLAVSVFLPYRPETSRYLSAVHVGCAFSASALLYLLLFLLAFKMYFYRPETYRRPVVFLLAALPVCLFLFADSGWLISSSLETFFTIFCCLWLNRFYRLLPG